MLVFYSYILLWVDVKTDVTLFTTVTFCYQNSSNCCVGVSASYGAAL